jgi:hypothetical protein
MDEPVHFFSDPSRPALGDRVTIKSVPYVITNIYEDYTTLTISLRREPIEVS